MANKSVVTQEQFQSVLQNYHENLVYPYLNGATHTGCVPLGTILPYFGETAPTHFLICDGTEYAKADYLELAEHLLALTDPTPYEGSDSDHFKVPDLRGEFLRGSGTNGHTNQGSGADVGVHQDGTLHKHTFSNENSYGPSEPFNSAWTQAAFQYDSKKTVSNIQNRTSNSGIINTTPQTDLYTSRPTNTSVTYIIAYRNAYIDLALDSFPIDISNPTDGQALVWNASAGRWKNAGILHEYSTDEHIVGIWIDGKPLYEKTIDLKIDINSVDNEGYSNFSINSYIPYATCKMRNVISTWTDLRWRNSDNFNAFFGTHMCRYIPGSRLYRDVCVTTVRSYNNSNDIMITLPVSTSDDLYVEVKEVIATIQYTKTTD